MVAKELPCTTFVTMISVFVTAFAAFEQCITCTDRV